jgi:molybdate transport system substrate-binding protein
MTKKFHLSALLAAVTSFGAIAFGANNAIGAEIKVLASANASLRSALTELAPQFERSTGHKVAMDFASATPLRQRIAAGEAFDIVIAPGLSDDLIKQGKVASDTRTTLARTGLGIGVLKGAPRPDISTLDAFKRTLLNAKSVGNNRESEPGTHFLAILDQLAIAQDVRPRLKDYRTSADMGAALERRDVDIVVSSITNLRETATIDVVGFPSEIQKPLTMTAGVSASTKEPEAAKALLRFLLSPTATSVFKAKGFERDG